jgi:hypothetical protein
MYELRCIVLVKGDLHGKPVELAMDDIFVQQAFVSKNGEIYEGGMVIGRFANHTADEVGGRGGVQRIRVSMVREVPAVDDPGVARGDRRGGEGEREGVGLEREDPGLVVADVARSCLERAGPAGLGGCERALKCETARGVLCLGGAEGHVPAAVDDESAALFERCVRIERNGFVPCDVVHDHSWGRARIKYNHNHNHNTYWSGTA